MDEGATRDLVRQMSTMVCDIQQRLLTIACRGVCNANMKAELEQKLDWLRRELREF